jgi:hypothetical protein
MRGFQWGPLKKPTTYPPPRMGRLVEIGQQGATGGHHGGLPPTLKNSPAQSMANYMMQPQSQGGYWTPYPPNFPLRAMISRKSMAPLMGG